MPTAEPEMTMLLDAKTIRPWARKNGWEPGERGMLWEMIHDQTYVCEACSERFTDRDEMGQDDDGNLTGFCECCENHGFAPAPVRYNARDFL